jgi:hypothetical protein
MCLLNSSIQRGSGHLRTRICKQDNCQPLIYAASVPLRHSVKKQKVLLQLWPDHLDMASVVQLDGRVEATYSIRINQPFQGHRRLARRCLRQEQLSTLTVLCTGNQGVIGLLVAILTGIYVSGSVYDPLSSSKGLLEDRGMLERRLGEIVGPVYLTSPNLM